MSDEYTGEERRASQGWHVKKEFSVGHILTTITMLIGIIFAYTDLKQHDAVQDTEFRLHVAAQEKTEASQSNDIKTVLDEIKGLRKDAYRLMQEHTKMHMDNMK